MSIYMRALEAHAPAEHAALARQLSAPAAAAMRQCTVSVWDGGELSGASSSAADEQETWSQELASATVRVGPGLVFRLGTMLVGPMVGGRVTACIGLA